MGLPVKMASNRPISAVILPPLPFLTICVIQAILLPQVLPQVLPRARGTDMAARKRLTDSRVRDLKPKPKRYTLWEGGSFGIRVTPRGVKSWVWLYRFEGRARRATFGTYPLMSLRGARIELANAQDRLARGEDPGETLVEKHRNEREAETIKQLTEDFIEKYASKIRSGPEYERTLRKDVIPKWGNRKATSIRRRDVADLLDAIVNRGAPIQANHVLGVVKKMFNWAVQRGALDFNPAAATVKPGVETPRTRKLTPKEIRTLWHGLPDTDMHPLIQLVLKFSLVTGQRKGECLNAKIADFDLTGDYPTWLIPTSNSKNKRPNLVPLSPLAVTLYKEIISVARDSTEWLFPTTINNGRQITTRAINQALTRNLETLGLKDVRPHDMRRAASTGMASVGVLREIREHVLNHSRGKLDQAYDQHDYSVEKRDALERWADKLTVILNTDEKVVELEPKTA